MRGFCGTDIVCGLPSMKVPPKRKGNGDLKSAGASGIVIPLNESPSEKEGKFDVVVAQAPPAFSLNESPSEKEGK